MHSSCKVGVEAPRFSVVIPVYNSELIVLTTIAQTIEFFGRRGVSWEIIAVNDGSSDGSWEILCEIARTTPCVTAVDLAFNHGQHTATLCGLTLSTGDFVVSLDDDMQQPPGEIARLMDKAEQGHDLVCGRFRRRGGPIRQAGSWAVGQLDQWFFHKPAGFVFSSFRLMRRDVVQRLCAYGGRDPYLRGLLVRCASSPVNVWVEHRPRPVGQSGCDAIKIARFGLRMLRTYWELNLPTPRAPRAAIQIREVVGHGCDHWVSSGMLR